MKKFLSPLLALFLLAGCSSVPNEPLPPEAAQSVIAPLPSVSTSAVQESAPPPQEQPDPRQEAIDALLSSMTAEEKVGQLFFARCPLEDAAALAEEYHLGGYLLFGRDFKNKTREQVQQDIASYQQAAAIPLLIGVDEEGGTVARVSANPNLRPQRFSSPQQLYAQGGLEAILADTVEKDALLQDLGIHVNFAPVADLSTNPEDFMYLRTLGRDAQETAAYISCVVSQMEADGMGSVLKHFPGYGPNVDTHTGAALDERPLEQFWAEDFLPFQAGIQAAQGGSTAVLVSHNIMAAVDETLPASLSPAVHQLLREDLAFQGVILTDDLAMDAAADYHAAPAVLALAAGNDMLVSTDFATEISQILSALEEGVLSMEQIDEAAARVLGWKYDLGLLA